jgi:PEP-CTERM motif
MKKGSRGFDGVVGAFLFVRPGEDLPSSQINPHCNHSPKTKHQPMKKLLFTLMTLVTCVAAFAQGKVALVNDTLHLVYWNPDPLYSPPGLAGAAVNSDSLIGFNPVVDLYMGTSSSTLYLYSSTTFVPLATAPGRWSPANVISVANPTTGAPFIPGGTTVFVELQVRDAYSTPPNIFDSNAQGMMWPWGASVEFTFLLSPGPTYPPLWGILGTWPVGTFNMDQYGVGSRGAIMVGYIPEPSTFALSGLGAAAMLLFRRRK